MEYISLSTAQRWLHLEGFKYTQHRKGLYFDGHDHVDVVEWGQNVFLPAMKGYEQRLVCYVIGDVNQEVILPCNNYVEHHLVLLPQDEMTSQANDIVEMMWVYKNEYHLRKKGPGHGLHQSETICSTVGWLKEGTQMLEYGKNYDGYWNGELFIKQVSIIILETLSAIVTDQFACRSKNALSLHLKGHMAQVTRL